MGQFVGCVQGIAAACKALEFPVVSGNVSLYNETNGRAILPTPTIGGVGLLDDFAKSASIAFKAADELIVLLGETKGWLGQSLYLREICGREEGAPPPVDLMAERRAGDFVRGLIEESVVTAVHDLSDGGLLVAVAEMALASGIGAKLYGPPAFLTEHGFWFGEDQARYVVTIKPEQFDDLAARAKTAGVPIRRIGMTHGNALTLPGERPILLDTLRERHEGWLPGYMAGRRKTRICTMPMDANEIERADPRRDPGCAGDHPRSRRRRRPLRRDRDCGIVQGQIAGAAAPAGLSGPQGRNGRQTARSGAADRHAGGLNFLSNFPNRRGLGCTSRLALHM